MAWMLASRLPLLVLLLCGIFSIASCTRLVTNAANTTNSGCSGRTRHLGSSRKKPLERRAFLEEQSSVPRNKIQKNFSGFDYEVSKKWRLSPLLTAYKSNAQLLEAIKDFATKCSNISRVYTIGKSVNGVPLMVLEISDNPGQFEAEPAFKYIGNMHGNEPTGRELTLFLAEWLCANYLKDELATLIVQNVHLHLLPSMNPDGFQSRTRNNANDVDLNRDFPDQYFALNNNLSERQPETRAIMQWTENIRFAASASLHEGALVASYGWDGTLTGRTGYSESPDDGGLKYLASLYAQYNPSMKKSQEFPGGITNGAAWYPLYGGMQDWNYIHGGCFEITLEMNEQKWPDISKVPGLWRQHRNSMLQLVASLVKSGVHGRVISSADGRPLPATIMVKGFSHSINASSMYGDYHRILPVGKNYEVTARMEGYSSRTTTVVLSQSKSTWLDFILDPVPTSEVYVQQRHADMRLPGSRKTPIGLETGSSNRQESVALDSSAEPVTEEVTRDGKSRRPSTIEVRRVGKSRRAAEHQDLVTTMTFEQLRVVLAGLVIVGALLYVLIRCRGIQRLPTKHLVRRT